MYLVGVGFVCNVLTPKIDKNNFDYNIMLRCPILKEIFHRTYRNRMWKD